MICGFITLYLSTLYPLCVHLLPSGEWSSTTKVLRKTDSLNDVWKYLFSSDAYGMIK